MPAASMPRRVDDEDLRERYCVPFSSLTAPVEVGEIGYPPPSFPPSNIFTPSTPYRAAQNLTIQTKLTRKKRSSRAGTPAFFSLPPLGPLLFANEASDARDHCANERTFLSYLRLSVYMAVVSVAVTLSFHVRQRPSEAELRVARPLGAVFWVLSVVLLFLGLGNYISEIPPSPSYPHLSIHLSIYFLSPLDQAKRRKGKGG